MADSNEIGYNNWRAQREFRRGNGFVSGSIESPPSQPPKLTTPRCLPEARETRPLQLKMKNIELALKQGQHCCNGSSEPQRSCDLGTPFLGKLFISFIGIAQVKLCKNLKSVALLVLEIRLRICLIFKDCKTQDTPLFGKIASSVRIAQLKLCARCSKISIVTGDGFGDV